MSSSSRPSVQDVARLAGVSVGTVSNVLNNPGRVRAKTIEKVNLAISHLGFIRNDAARQLKAGTSQTIGLVVLDATNPFFGDLARGAEDQALLKGLSLILGSSGNDEQRETKYLSLFEEQRMAGVLLSPAGLTPSVISGIRRRGLKTVLVDRMAHADVCCSVGVDDVAGGRTAVNHLLNLGRKQIAFVGGTPSISQVADRLAGAREAIAGVPGAQIRVFESSEMNVFAGRAIGEQILALEAQFRPDGVFAANDLLAVGLLQALVFRSEMRVPEDVAIIGYDDIDFAEAAIVPLSSIRQPANAIGATAIELLLDEIENPDEHVHRQVMYQPELVVRTSSKKT